MKNYLLFDLDGTLTDPMEGITNSVAYALDAYGIHVEDRRTLIPFIGPPLVDSFMEFYGFSREKAEEAVWKYREYFSDKGIFENKVIPGIPKALEMLCDKGHILLLATSKPEVYARQIMERFGLAPYFTGIYGADLEGRGTAKADVISYAMTGEGIRDASQALMTGDRSHDIVGAKACKMAAVGVLFGYGSRQELEEAGADAIADTVEEMARLLAEYP